MVQPRGALIAFEGLDRSGKSTQCQLLADHLRSQGHAVSNMRFPNRTTSIGQMINSYLAGQTQAEDHVIHLLFSANRWESAAEIERLIAAGTTVVLDRYYYSGIVYSAAKRVDGMGLEWCRQPEVGLPRPDVCVFLDVDTEVAKQRGGFGEERYEKAEMQGRVRELFAELKVNGGHEGDDIVVVDAGREVEEVEKEIWRVIDGVVNQVAAGGNWLKKVDPW
ncbi:Thymidylate kinase [Friedmanniomyces endolithicus]|nr:Thymidylate kinase [Friedmanniomyces endolithicus]KAK1825229.1 Thymidylate kinase [Friedmanniomyces endolithicus]